MSCGVVIAAAGQGKRMGMGINKQLIPIDGVPLLIHTLSRFVDIPWIHEIVVVVHPDELSQMTHLIEKYNIHVTAVLPGGNERQDSIYQGIMAIKSDWVMVHDGARPFIEKSLLEALYRKVKLLDAVAIGVRVKDTIKIVDEEGKIKHTPDRKSLWSIQTPQAFRLSLLLEAYNQAEKKGFLGTDDASLVEWYGRSVYILEGSYRNIKVTTKEDLVVAESFMKHWE